MRVTLVSPYHGGSHEAWATGLRDASKHEVEILSLPARFWKWRMHGGALTLARRFCARATRTDVILATDMLDLSTFLALTRSELAGTPAVLYMHENQLTYPLPDDPLTGAMRRQGGERDQHYAFINLSSMLAADRVLFNSRYHLVSWFEALPAFLRHFPEFNELEAAAALREKSDVLPVGIDTRALDKVAAAASPVTTAGSDAERPKAARANGERPADSRRPARGHSAGRPPLVLWNQRWEYDKNPAAFFDALGELAEEGIPFRVALCGERFSQQPEEFDAAIADLGDRVEHVGYAEPERYARLLWESDVTASTAHHEFFGIAILEAIYCGSFAVLPDRLSYPELLPPAAHKRCLYSERGGLLEHLRWALQNPEEATGFAHEVMAPHVGGYAWDRLAPAYDRTLEAVAGA